MVSGNSNFTGEKVQMNSWFAIAVSGNVNMYNCGGEGQQCWWDPIVKTIKILMDDQLPICLV